MLKKELEEQVAQLTQENKDILDSDLTKRKNLTRFIEGGKEEYYSASMFDRRNERVYSWAEIYFELGRLKQSKEESMSLEETVQFGRHVRAQFPLYWFTKKALKEMKREGLITGEEYKFFTTHFK